MRFTILLAASAMATVLTACGGNPPENPEVDIVAEAPTPEVPLEAVVVEAPAMVGQFCYFSDTETETEGLDVTLTETGEATGRHFGSIHNEAAAYYTAFDIALSNGEVGEAQTVNFDAVIEVDGDTHRENIDWVITAQSASEVGVEKIMSSVRCNGLMDRVWPPMVE